MSRPTIPNRAESRKWMRCSGFVINNDITVTINACGQFSRKLFLAEDDTLVAEAMKCIRRRVGVDIISAGKD